MRIEIDTDKLPEGMTEKQVFDAIEGSLMVYIGSFTGAPDHEEGCKTAALVWRALVKPTPLSDEVIEREPVFLEEWGTYDYY